MENANSHPFKVSIVKDATMFANSHPYKVSIEGGGGNEGRVVDKLPEEGEPGYIYLVLKESTPKGDIYDEYMWVLQQDGETYGWEHIGATNEVNLDVVKILTEDDYNWNSRTGSATEPYDVIALWLLDDGLYKAPDVAVYPVRDHIVSGNTGNLYLVSKVESNNRRGMVACFMGDSSVLFSAVDSGGMNYLESKFFRNVQQQTGSSTKDLMSQKAITDAINNVDGIKTLTTADYNYDYGNTGSNNTVALWLLDEGLYRAEEGVNVSATSSVVNATDPLGWKLYGNTYLVGPTYTGESFPGKQIIAFHNKSLGMNNLFKTVTKIFIGINDLATGAATRWDSDMTQLNIANNLTTTLANYVLDARQGKILNDKIGQIETVLQTITTGNGV